MYFAVSALCCDLFFILFLVFIPCLHTSHIPQFREFTLTPSISSQGESLVLAEAGSAEERRLKKARKRTATVEQGEHTHTHTHTHTLEHTHTHTHTLATLLYKCTRPSQITLGSQNVPLHTAVTRERTEQ